MKLEVQVISNEIITPSSPTPHHLRTYHLSSIDLKMSHAFATHFLFYPFDHNNQISISDRTNQLKNSLSQVLTLFYPLAGRFVNHRYINCNDEGVTFTEARANCKLWDFVNDAEIKQVNKLFSCNLDDPTDHPMIIQATLFECGGMALAVAIFHHIADGWSFFMFLKSWAGTSRGDDTRISTPIFNSATLFPPKDFGNFVPEAFVKKEEDVITKIFMFPSRKINALKHKYTNKEKDGNTIIPTRVEALSAFIWTRFKISTQAKDDTNKTYILTHSVNMRTKVAPPLPENSFGNIIQEAKIFLSSEDAIEGNHEIVGNIKGAIRSFGGDQETKLREINDGSLSSSGIKDGAKGEVVTLAFTSTLRFPVYNTDFGWGIPVWVATASLPYRNIILFQDSPLGDGIEAWVYMKREDMVKFEADEELSAYVASGNSNLTSPNSNLIPESHPFPRGWSR